MYHRVPFECTARDKWKEFDVLSCGYNFSCRKCNVDKVASITNGLRDFVVVIVVVVVTLHWCLCARQSAKPTTTFSKLYGLNSVWLCYIVWGILKDWNGSKRRVEGGGREGVRTSMTRETNPNDFILSHLADFSYIHSSLLRLFFS